MSVVFTVVQEKVLKISKYINMLTKFFNLSKLSLSDFRLDENMGILTYNIIYDACNIGVLKIFFEQYEIVIPGNFIINFYHNSINENITHCFKNDYELECCIQIIISKICEIEKTIKTNLFSIPLSLEKQPSIDEQIKFQKLLLLKEKQEREQQIWEQQIWEQHMIIQAWDQCEKERIEQERIEQEKCEQKEKELEQERIEQNEKERIKQNKILEEKRIEIEKLMSERRSKVKFVPIKPESPISHEQKIKSPTNIQKFPQPIYRDMIKKCEDIAFAYACEVIKEKFKILEEGRIINIYNDIKEKEKNGELLLFDNILKKDYFIHKINKEFEKNNLIIEVKSKNKLLVHHTKVFIRTK
jgi:hypothetical protein